LPWAPDAAVAAPRQHLEAHRLQTRLAHFRHHHGEQIAQRDERLGRIEIARIGGEGQDFFIESQADEVTVLAAAALRSVGTAGEVVDQSGERLQSLARKEAPRRRRIPRSPIFQPKNAIRLKRQIAVPVAGSLVEADLAPLVLCGSRAGSPVRAATCGEDERDERDGEERSGHDWLHGQKGKSRATFSETSDKDSTYW